MRNIELDIEGNRKVTKYTTTELLKRILWSLIKPLFRYSPRPFFGWRNYLLRLMGAKIGKHVHIYNSATIYFPWNLEVGAWSSIGEHAFIYNLGQVTIGKQVTISYRSHLCAGTHDHTNPLMQLLKLPISVKNESWICTDAFIGPGVEIGEGAVVGARAVVVKDVKPWTIVAGNPARIIGKRNLLKTDS